MIVGIHHVQLTIPTGAEVEARVFYCSVLGLEEIPKPESLQGRGGFWLRVGGHEVHLGTEDGVDRQKSKGHIAYLVSDLETWERKLIEYGIQPIAGIPIPGFTRLVFRDPFGNRVEMLQKLG